MAIVSAGVLLYRRHLSRTEVFLVHHGGPLWAKKDQGAWSVPKGIVAPGEDALAGARREFLEETGFQVPEAVQDLGAFRYSGGKQLRVWASAGDCHPEQLRSNSFELEWPPGSGRVSSFPEVDRGGWFTQSEALLKVSKGQRQIIERFFSHLRDEASGE